MVTKKTSKVFLWTFLTIYALLSLNTATQHNYVTKKINNRPALTRPNVGVVFRPLQHSFIPSDSKHHVLFSIPFPNLPTLPSLPKLNRDNCENHEEEFRNTNDKFAIFAAQTQLRIDRQLQDSAIVRNDSLYPQTLGYDASMQAVNMMQPKIQQKQAEYKKQACYQLADFVTTFRERYNKYREEIRKGHKSLQDLLVKKAEDRVKRDAILGFLSPIFSGIFGLADQEDLKNIQRNFDTVYANQDSLYNFTQILRSDLTTLGDITNKRINNTWDALEKTSERVLDIKNELHHITKNIPKYFREIEAKITNVYSWLLTSNTLYDNINLMLLDAMSIQYHLSQWRQAVIGLANGLVPEQLITLKDMQQALKAVERNLRSKYHHFQVIHGADDAAYYYLHDFATSFIHRDEKDQYSLVVHVGVPLATVDAYYDIFQVVIKPVPLISNATTNKGYTMLDTKVTTEYFVVSANQQTFTHMTATDLQYCVSLQDSTCPLLQSINDRKLLSCLAAIYFQLAEIIQSTCKFLLYPDAALPPFIEYVSDGVHLVSSPTGSFEINCPNKARNIQNSNYALVTLPCACSIDTADARVPPTLANCNDKTYEIQISYPINAPQALLFDIPNMNIHEPELSIPHVEYAREYQEFDIQKLRHYDNELAIDFQKKALTTGGGSISIKKPVPIISTNGISWRRMVPTINSVIMGLTVFYVIGLSLFLYVKYKQYYPIWLIVRNLIDTQVEACHDHTDIDKLVKAIDETWQVDLVLSITLAIVNILVLYCIKMTVRNDKQDKASSSALFLVVSNLKTTKYIKVLKLPTCLSDVTMAPVPKAHAKVKEAWFGQPKLTLTYPKPWTIKVAKEVFTLQKDITGQIPQELGNVVRQRNFNTEDMTDNIAILYELVCFCGCGRRTIVPRSHNGWKSTPKTKQESSPTPRVEPVTLQISESAISPIIPEWVQPLTNSNDSSIIAKAPGSDDAEQF